MSHPLRVVAHVGDVVENLLQGPSDLDAFFDTHGSASCAPKTFSPQDAITCGPARRFDSPFTVKVDERHLGQTRPASERPPYCLHPLEGGGDSPAVPQPFPWLGLPEESTSCLASRPTSRSAAA